VQAVVSYTGVEVKAVQQDVGGLEVSVGHCAVKMEVVQAPCDVDRDLQPLCPGQWRTSSSWSICAIREPSQQSR
jgi:hypothetical protein